MSTRLKVVMMAGSVLLFGGLLVACGGDEDGGAKPAEGDAEEGGTTVKVVMTETEEAWGYELGRSTVPAGLVTFEAVNEGKFEHELMVYPAQDLSQILEEMVMAEMSGEEAGHAEEIEGLVFSVDGEEELELEPGDDGTFTVNLTPGTYELGCLIVETLGGETFTHHEKGMYATLTVQ